MILEPEKFKPELPDDELGPEDFADDAVGLDRKLTDENEVKYQLLRAGSLLELADLIEQHIDRINSAGQEYSGRELARRVRDHADALEEGGESKEIIPDIAGLPDLVNGLIVWHKIKQGEKVDDASSLEFLSADDILKQVQNFDQLTDVITAMASQLQDDQKNPLDLPRLKQVIQEIEVHSASWHRVQRDGMHALASADQNKIEQLLLGIPRSHGLRELVMRLAEQGA